MEAVRTWQSRKIGKPALLDLTCLTVSNFIKLIGSDLSDSKVVVYNGIDSQAYRINADCNDIDFSQSKYGNDFLVSVYKKDHVPFTKLYAQNAYISLKKNYVVSSTKLIGNTNPAYRIVWNGILSIRCLEDFESIRGFEVGEGGILNLQVDKNFKSKDDKVCSGGSMKVTGGVIELQSGFTVHKGGTLTIQNL